MVRKRKPSHPDALKTVGIHPELHKILHLQAIEEGQTLQERIHMVLCQELGRLDLLSQAPDTATASVQRA